MWNITPELSMFSWIHLTADDIKPLVFRRLGCISLFLAYGMYFSLSKSVLKWMKHQPSWRRFCIDHSSFESWMDKETKCVRKRSSDANTLCYTMIILPYIFKCTTAIGLFFSTVTTRCFHIIFYPYVSILYFYHLSSSSLKTFKTVCLMILMYSNFHIL